jgi:hypothetical protein
LGQAVDAMTRLIALILTVAFLALAGCERPQTASHGMLHPEFPVIEGRYQMTPDWAVTLPQPFNQRFEDDSLVFWRPGITVWTIVWGNDKNES